VPAEEVASIEGLDEDIAAELQSRATEALDRREAAAREERRALGVDDALAEMPHLNEAMLVTLGKAGIKTLDDLADLATDELVQKKRPEQRRQREPNNRPEDKGGILAEYGLSDEQGNEIIMAARAHWFEDEDGASSGQEDALADPAQ
jgi:N utilization substance protein A